jgi:putative ABC transport system substrate-binding protein
VIYKRKYLHFLNKVAHFAFVFSLLLPSAAKAYTGITVVFTTPTPAYLEFVDNLKDELAITKKNTLKVKVIELKNNEKLVVAENSELVIALGVKALEQASRLKSTTPVLGAFIPLPVFNALLSKSRRDLGNFSAIVLDQPYWRQMSLIKTMLPEATRLGVLLGKTSVQNSDYLAEEAREVGLNLDIENVNDNSELIPKLIKALDVNDALLAIPNQQIYNRETAEPILLTSYRHQKPVFGYSQSFVRAGALAAVYSNTKQLARQAAEIATASQLAPVLLPPPQSPKYFSILVNRQVARLLNIALSDNDTIYNSMLKLETAEHDEDEDEEVHNK